MQTEVSLLPDEYQRPAAAGPSYLSDCGTGHNVAGDCKCGSNTGGEDCSTGGIQV